VREKNTHNGLAGLQVGGARECVRAGATKGSKLLCVGQPCCVARCGTTRAFAYGTSEAECGAPRALARSPFRVDPAGVLLLESKQSREHHLAVNTSHGSAVCDKAGVQKGWGRNTIQNR